MPRLKLVLSSAARAGALADRYLRLSCVLLKLHSPQLAAYLVQSKEAKYHEKLLQFHLGEGIQAADEYSSQQLSATRC